MIRMKPAVRVKKVKHSREAEQVLQAIDEYINDNEAEVAEVLTYFWKDQQNAVTYAELRELVQDGYVTSEQVAQWSQDYSVLVQNKLNGVWEASAFYGSLTNPALIERKLVMNPTMAGATNWIKEHGAEFVTNCTEQQKGAIAHLLQFEMMQKHSVEEIARMIRPCIGLTKGQAATAMKYYDTVKRTLQEEHPRMKKENVELRAYKAAQKYAEKAHRQRAETIAQTELAKAYNHGAHEGIKQAQAAGLMGAVKKVWSTANDHRVCPHCEALDGLTVGIDGGFGWSKYLFQDSDELPPAHPLCRCAVQYVEIEPPRIETGYQGEDEEDIESERNWYDKVIDEGKRQADILTRNRPGIALSELQGKYEAEFFKEIMKSPEHIKKLISENADEIKFLKTNALLKKSRYSHKYGGIFCNMSTSKNNEAGPYIDLFHEMGHALDTIYNNHSFSKEFEKLIRNDVGRFINFYAKSNGIGKMDAILDICAKMNGESTADMGITSDLFSGIFGKDKYDWPTYHSDKYWSKPGNLTKEAFAHFFSAEATQTQMDAMKNIFPESFNWVLNFIKGAV